MNVLSPLTMTKTAVDELVAEIIQTTKEIVWEPASRDKEHLADQIKEAVEKAYVKHKSSGIKHGFNPFEAIKAIELDEFALAQINDMKASSVREASINMWMIHNVQQKHRTGYWYNEIKSGTEVNIIGKPILSIDGTVHIVEAVYEFSQSQLIKVSDKDSLIEVDAYLDRAYPAFLTEEQTEELYEMYINDYSTFTCPKSVKPQRKKVVEI